MIARTTAVALLFAAAALADDDAAAKAVRMRTTRQLKEILDDLEIKYPKNADKDALRELALEEDAITKYEEKHPEKKKKKATGGMPGMPGGMPDMSNIGEMLFPMLDKDKDGKLSMEEYSTMASLMGGMGGDAGGAEKPDPAAAFKQMDLNGDGELTKEEVSGFFKMVSSMMGKMGGPGGMMGGPGGMMGGPGGMMGGPGGMGAEPTSQPKPPPADDDDLPGHEEL